MLLKTSRRGLLKAGLLGTMALVAGGTVATLSGCSRKPVSELGFRFLREQDLVFLSALAPAILKDNYPGPLGPEAETRLLKSLDGLMATLGEFSQNQLLQLFDLMAVGPARFVAGGPMGSWSDASTEQVDEFLISWRDSMFSLKRMGYVSLSKLITMSWYSQPENYVQTGYPGPPKKYPA